MKFKQQFVVIGLMMLCATCLLVVLYVRHAAQSGINAKPGDDQQFVESPARTTDAPTTSSTTVVAASNSVNNFDAVNEVSSDWPIIVNRKYGFSYTQAYDDALNVTVYNSDLPLSDYVKNIWTLNKHEANTSSEGKTVSAIVQTEINGSTAYQFVLSKSFTWDQGGYLLDEPYLYTFFETAQGIKVIARVPVNDPNHQAVLNTFKVDATLIPANEAPSNWQQAQYGFYAFKFPSNVFTVSEAHSTDETAYLEDTVEGMRGGVSITVRKAQFDPRNIQDMYGEIRDPEKVTLGDTTWYTYMWGDAGATARIYVTGIENSHTIKVSFGSMQEEDVYPVSDDVVLQHAILETFTFENYAND